MSTAGLRYDGPMTPENRNSAIAAAILLAVFGLGAFYLPTIMIAVGNISTVAAGAIAILFVAAFFLVFWLRGRSQRKRGG
jgi:drug/metabolite transporter (DMT)-like permease